MGNRQNKGYGRITTEEDVENGLVEPTSPQLIQRKNTQARSKRVLPHQQSPNAKKTLFRTWITGFKTIKLILPYFWPKNDIILRIRVIVSLSLIIIAKLVNLFIPLLYKKVIDSLPESFPLGTLILYGFFKFLSPSIGNIRDSVWLHVENYATQSVAVDTFTHLQNLSLGFHLTRNTGALLRIMDRGKNAITTVLETLGFTLGPALAEVVLTCIILLSNFGGFFALITLTSVVLYVVFTFTVTEWRTKYRKLMNEKDNETSNTGLDSLINFETVKYFTAERHEVNRYSNAITEYFKASVKSQYSLAFLNIGQQFLIQGGVSVNILLAAYYVTKGKLTIGDVVAIAAYVSQVYAPLSWLGTSYRMIMNSFTDMEKLFELLNEYSEVYDEPNAVPLKVRFGEVEFENVSFTYPSRDNSTNPGGITNNDRTVKENKTTLKNVSFKIPAGKTVAIVGQSGSGKTTISRLLCRFYNTDSGRILIDGQDISHVTQFSLRKSIGVVPQDTVLFNDTIYYNILYGKVAKGDDKYSMSVEEAAKEAKLHDFIVSTPHGYETKVGERGLRLSGGEKQRVAIARTILKDPQILILDEATSALDSITEREIQASLMEVSKGRTTLIVAHRLSTIVDADEIIVLKNGEIMERGSHKQLLESRGEYFKMWDLQAKEANKKSKEQQDVADGVPDEELILTQDEQVVQTSNVNNNQSTSSPLIQL